MRKFARQRSLWEGEDEVEDDDWDEEYDDDEEGSCPEGLEVDGPSIMPSWTGLLNAKGEPILRHPIVPRVGFHPPDRQFHAPTLDEDETAPGASSVVGWVYDV